MQCKWRYITGLGFLVIYNFSHVMVPEYIKRILQEIQSLNRRQVVMENTLYAIIYLGLTCFFMYHMRNFIIQSSRKIESEIRKNIFQKLLQLPVKFYQKEQTGDLISRIINDISDVRTMVGPGIMYIPNSVTRLIFFMPVMYSISARLTIFISFLLVALIILILIIMPRLRPFYKRIQENRAKINNYAWQMISGIITIKINSMERRKLSEFDQLNDHYIKENLRLVLVEQFNFPFFSFTFSISSVFVLWIGSTEIINGNITKEELLQFNLMLSVMTFPIFSLGWVMSLLQQGISALERIQVIFNEKYTKNSTTGQSLKNQPHTIKIKNLVIKNDDGKEILKNINLSIKPGKIIGISGKTGSGKTTLLECILNFIPANHGEITIDGININDIDLNNLYKEVSFVPQEPFLFSDSIKNNIGFEEDGNIDFERVLQAAKDADLEQDIHTFAQKYDQEIGERGITLSGGQKQRTTLARAIYKQSAKLLILDDSLSSLDSETEENIIKNLKNKDKNQSIILVSHKISLLRVTDEIHFFDKGQIIESGSHEELLAKKGAYAVMAKLQELEKSIH